jgi:hypothetical protein
MPEGKAFRIGTVKMSQRCLFEISAKDFAKSAKSRSSALIAFPVELIKLKKESFLTS